MLCAILADVNGEQQPVPRARTVEGLELQQVNRVGPVDDDDGPVRPEGILIQRCALGPCLVEGRLCLIGEPPAMLDSIDGELSERTTPRPPERSVIDSFDDQEVGEPLDLSHLRLFAP